MKTYMEDESNKHFWEITLEEDLLLIRSGAKGSSGECELTEFKTQDEARMGFNKEVQERLDSGYRFHPHILKREERKYLEHLFEAQTYESLMDCCGGFAEMDVIIVEGKVDVDSTFNGYIERVKRQANYTSKHSPAILFTDDLTVHGEFLADDNLILVLGTFKCETIVQRQDFGDFYFKNAKVSKYLLLLSTHGALIIDELVAPLMFAVNCFPMVKSFKSDIQVFCSKEYAQTRAFNDIQYETFDIADLSIFDEALVNEFSLTEEDPFSDLLASSTPDFVKYLEEGKPILK